MWKRGLRNNDFFVGTRPTETTGVNTCSVFKDQSYQCLTLGKKDKAGNKTPASPSKILKPEKSPSLRNAYSHPSAGPLSGFSDEEMVASVTGKIKISQRSQLSKSLSEVLRDKGALGYFIKYLESQRALPLIKFWLDVESFRALVLSSKPSATRPSVKPATRDDLDLQPKTSPQHSQRSLGTDCDSLFESPSHSIDSADNTSTVSNFQDTRIHHRLDSTSPNSKTETQSNLDTPTTVRTRADSSSGDLHLVEPDNVTVLHNSINEANNVFLKDSSARVEQSVSTLSAVSSGSSRSLSPSNTLQAVVHEAVRIYRKFLAPGCMQRVPIDSETRERVISAICREDGILVPETFGEAQTVAFRLLDSEHFNSFLHSDYHGKHQIDVLTSGKVTIEDILYNDTAFFYFMEFMEQEGNQSLVEFWIAAVNFQQHLASKEGSYDAGEAQNDAMILYDKYFSMQATCPLGFGDKIRLTVEQNICREEGPLPDCFQVPISIVQLVLEKNFLASFLSSELNMKYLTELVNTIQGSPALLRKHRKTGSESSSDWSVSAQNTLLASEDSAAPPAPRCGEMSIDSRQLNDPDALWRRRKHNGLRFGRINNMGRFETDVEPEPDRKEESRIARAVKKLVNMEEDKAKEEMAWQIAEMIVKDITSLTLGSSRSESLT